ncbi:hypothetical protein SERLA73DRAFT_177799 [Serpula lacrymans var. lacrymans S7.3]|uniref:DUF396-domain-containing protein n=2 Tax=Serpula lacrymans var. lacrymans TaxID=341189 RepID=F8PPL2_SERL3|nr:uncharacterized protein SERLADRAFT_461593 [Serpula lacrymans var. lacrymans S7.9]EGO02070.1 hypothetical protein SERLA73DRAFT_177799 [Serpula lacrymans var. lacrymans S7.3]EGO27692.1 hypothetical protein SERLADRAFT_461593 [Serpula lacrymans var. lacrymans S7.9]
MSLLHYLSYAAILSAFAFMTLSLASGLLYISELIEEHSRLAKVVGQRGIYAIMLLHFILYFSESLPLPQTMFSVLCHVAYLQNFSSTWPLISLTSLSFVLSCILAISDHFVWFFHFARITQEARHSSHKYRGPTEHISLAFSDIATFFAICVWLAPLFLFLSLSANDNALPTSSGMPSTPTSLRPTAPPSHSSLFKSLFSILPVGYISNLRLKSMRKDTSEGIIAPHSPNTQRRASSPMPSSPNPVQSTMYGNIRSRTPPRSATIPQDLDTSYLSPENFRLGSPPKRSSGPRVIRRATGDVIGLGTRRVASSALRASPDI